MPADVSALHPDLNSARLSEWALMRDVADGESAVKRMGEVYLPKPSGFTTQSDNGKAMYQAYKNRAQFPEILAPSISAMVGIIHDGKIQIKLPESMDFIVERATTDGLTLDAFHRRVTRQLLETGRYGILVDAPVATGDPFLAGYSAETIINWESDGSFYVLDETSLIRDEFEWGKWEQWRRLEMLDGVYVATVFVGPEKTSFEVLPVGRGGAKLEEVPFVVATARDLSPIPEPPPLVGVARAAVAIYQLSADYRHQLFMSGQETLVIINGTAPTVVGAGAVIALEGDDSRKPDAKYIGPNGVGIEAHKTAIEDNRKAAVLAGARMFDEGSRVQESGEARRLRFAAETATLLSIAHNSCAAMEKALRWAAILTGANPDEVIITAPTDLLDTVLSPEQAQALLKLWMDGGISYETFYDNLQRGGVADIDRTAEEELALIDSEGVDVEPDEAGLLRLPVGESRNNEEETS